MFSRLTFNGANTECLFIGTKQQLPKLFGNSSVEFAGVSIKSSDEVRNLEVVFDWPLL